MINKIGVDNFRVFKDYTEFDLGTISLLTGPNNSGKSSFLKLLDLLKTSVLENNSLNALLFNKGSHNLGTFEGSLNNDSDSDILKIRFDFPLDYFDENFDLEIGYEKSGEIGFIKSFRIFNFNTELVYMSILLSEMGGSYKSLLRGDTGIDYEYRINLDFIKKAINKERLRYADTYPKFVLESYYHYICNELEIQDSNFESWVQNFDPLKEINLDKMGVLSLLEYAKLNFSDIFDEISSKMILFYNYRREGDKKLLNEDFLGELLEIEQRFSHSTLTMDNYYYSYKNSDFFTDSFFRDWEITRWWDWVNHEVDDNQKHILDRDSEVYKIYNSNNIGINLEIGKTNNELFNRVFSENINKSLSLLKLQLQGIDFTSSNRGSKSRIYVNDSLTEMDQIIAEYSEVRNDLKDSFVEDSLLLLGIKGKLIIERIEGSGSIIYFLEGDKKLNLADLGFGYSQLIPMLLKIVIKVHIYQSLKLVHHDADPHIEQIIYDSEINKINPIFVIEEPEANLHPNLQSKIADILVLASKKFKLCFILETHSEYLIRKLQYLTARNEISPGDINIYYYNSDEFVEQEGEKVKKIQIRDDGGLTDTFGPGFFDESTQLQFELLRLNQSQHN